MSCVVIFNDEELEVTELATDVKVQRLVAKKMERAITRIGSTKANHACDREQFGESLLRIRELLPRSGPTAAVWGELLTACGLSQPTAWRLMNVAKTLRNKKSGLIQVNETKKRKSDAIRIINRLRKLEASDLRLVQIAVQDFLDARDAYAQSRVAA